jgi:hypothetical protein
MCSVPVRADRRSCAEALTHTLAERNSLAEALQRQENRIRELESSLAAHQIPDTAVAARPRLASTRSATDLGSSNTSSPTSSISGSAPLGIAGVTTAARVGSAGSAVVADAAAAAAASSANNTSVSGRRTRPVLSIDVNIDESEPLARNRPPHVRQQDAPVVVPVSLAALPKSRGR